MELSRIPFGTTDWARAERTEHKGESGLAYWQTRSFGGIQVRMVEYMPGYVAAHWCIKGRPCLTRASARAALVGGDVAPEATAMKTVMRIVSWA